MYSFIPSVIKDVWKKTQNKVKLAGVLTCTSHGRGVFLGPEEARLAAADGGALAVAEAVRRTLGTLDVSRVGFVEARVARWWVTEEAV